jgi:hypothetical protein
MVGPRTAHTYARAREARYTARANELKPHPGPRQRIPDPTPMPPAKKVQPGWKGYLRWSAIPVSDKRRLQMCRMARGECRAVSGAYAEVCFDGVEWEWMSQNWLCDAPEI